MPPTDAWMAAPMRLGRVRHERVPRLPRSSSVVQVTSCRFSTEERCALRRSAPSRRVHRIYLDELPTPLGLGILRLVSVPKQEAPALVAKLMLGDTGGLSRPGEMNTTPKAILERIPGLSADLLAIHIEVPQSTQERRRRQRVCSFVTDTANSEVEQFQPLACWRCGKRLDTLIGDFIPSEDECFQTPYAMPAREHPCALSRHAGFSQIKMSQVAHVRRAQQGLHSFVPEGVEAQVQRLQAREPGRQSLDALRADAAVLDEEM